jgi:hypothetical protein
MSKEDKAKLDQLPAPVLGGYINPVLYVPADGYWALSPLEFLGVMSNPGLVSVAGSGYTDKAWEISRNYVLLPVVGAAHNYIGPIVGSDYYEGGSVGGGLALHVMFVELEIIGDDGTSNTFRRVYVATLHKLAGSWDIVEDFTIVTALSKCTCAYTLTPTTTRAGSDDGDIGVDIGVNGGSGNPRSAWFVKLTIKGGGRYT